jgi:hypothetical protein
MRAGSTSGGKARGRAAAVEAQRQHAAAGQERQLAERARRPRERRPHHQDHDRRAEGVARHAQVRQEAGGLGDRDPPQDRAPRLAPGDQRGDEQRDRDQDRARQEPGRERALEADPQQRDRPRWVRSRRPEKIVVP